MKRAQIDAKYSKKVVQIEKKFAKRPDVVEANLLALKAGVAYDRLVLMSIAVDWFVIFCSCYF